MEGTSQVMPVRRGFRRSGLYLRARLVGVLLVIGGLNGAALAGLSVLIPANPTHNRLVTCLLLEMLAVQTLVCTILASRMNSTYRWSIVGVFGCYGCFCAVDEMTRHLFHDPVLHNCGDALIGACVLSIVGVVVETIAVIISKRRWSKHAVPAGPVCEQCGYSLLGGPHARCPECGTPIVIGENPASGVSAGWVAYAALASVLAIATACWTVLVVLAIR